MTTKFPPRDHQMTIEREYFHKEALYKWRVKCTCGYTSEWNLSARIAERASDQHLAAVLR